MSLSLTRYRLWMLGLGFFIVFLLSATFFVIDWVRFLYTPVVPPNTHVDYILPSGASVRILASDLNQLGMLRRPQYFVLLAYLKNKATHLHAGEYRFVAGTTPSQLLQQIAEGRVLWRQVTFPEGWTFYQILDTLENNPLIVHKLAGLPPFVIMINLGISGTHPEGLFFPDTYRYTAGMSDKAILLSAYQEMQNKLNAEWAKRASGLIYQNSYEALIAASIIEKEAQHNNERPMISGVIVRRLQKNMPLQMDPTVMYGLGPDFRPPLKRADLTAPSAYNTYLNTGLPPTPICMPGLASIHAAMHPAGGDYLYFVARGDGTHQFSATYAQHQEAVNKYISH